MISSAEEIKLKISELVSPKRFRHICGVRSEAEKLAAIWNADKLTVTYAALLHDCTKEMETNSQLNYCRKWGIIAGNDYIKSPQVLHQLSGAVYAEHEFGMNEQVCSAIRCHSTGIPDMTAEEKIIFIADLTEQSRPFGETEEIAGIRELSYTDINAAVLKEAELTIKRETERGMDIFPDTIETFNYYKKLLTK